MVRCFFLLVIFGNCLTVGPGIWPAAAQQNATPQDASPQDVAPQDALPQDASPQDSTPRDTAKGGIDGKPSGYWVEQLGHDHFLRREMATRKLIEAGPEVIADLVAEVRHGDLEVVERAMGIITAIALARPPRSDGGAWDRLNELAQKSAGQQSASARAAIVEVQRHRAQQAREALSAAGVFVGVDEFAIRAISRPLMLVQIDEKWNGDLEVLQWMRWLNGVENARVKGSAVRQDVMSNIAEVPGLRTLAIVDGKVDDATLRELQDIERLHSLELRYVPLSDPQGDLIASLPIRVSLNLMGTGISAEKVGSMRAQLPGLQIDHRQGGFLGVTCFDNFDVCEINGVLPDSAAEEAGLIPGDIVLRVGDAEVKRFRDLQHAINQHMPGDEVDVTFRRGGKIESVKLKLRRFEET